MEIEVKEQNFSEVFSYLFYQISQEILGMDCISLEIKIVLKWKLIDIDATSLKRPNYFCKKE